MTEPSDLLTALFLLTVSSTFLSNLLSVSKSDFFRCHKTLV
ncbi:hypothetical protein [Lactococcus lactis]|nr:hypothetical protein [Lactococcus lactis]MDT2906864.1 hypothetical protein [Lactococcus lactis]MDT2912092.1 hypothetical protein [Lactococcus lactis]MDT2933522.1 hypothetical protein [Lactococcus lactis]